MVKETHESNNRRLDSSFVGQPVKEKEFKLPVLHFCRIVSREIWINTTWKENIWIHAFLQGFQCEVDVNNFVFSVDHRYAICTRTQTHANNHTHTYIYIYYSEKFNIWKRGSDLVEMKAIPHGQRKKNKEKRMSEDKNEQINKNKILKKRREKGWWGWDKNPS